MRPHLLDELVCIECGGALRLEVFRREAGLWGGVEIVDGRLECACGAAYPIRDGVPRVVRADVLAKQRVEAQTARSFAYEWQQFGSLRPEWEANFWGYMEPLTAEELAGRRVLDAGCGSGRHAYHAGRAGAAVFAVDLGEAVAVAYRNTRTLPDVHVIQADLQRLPFRREAFDLVYSLGVLHHLPDPEGAFRRLLPHLRPGGEMRVYLYWALEHAPTWQRALLAGVTAARRATTRLPYPLLHALSYPIAAGAFFTFVLPYRALSRWRPARGLAESLPLKQYARYPFRVCVNDQFDRFSAPIERRYTRAQVTAWFERAGLAEVAVRPHFGWVGTGRAPVSLQTRIEERPLAAAAARPVPEV